MPEAFTMRAPCRWCGGETGTITQKSGQDCVYCVCGRYQYNAPKSETGRGDGPAPPHVTTGVLIYFDGANEPRNPGGTEAIGWQIFSEGVEVHRGHKIIAEGPQTTNNHAEWCGLGTALKIALVELKLPGPITIRGDSKLVVYQLSGSWKCNKSHLQKLRARCLEILAGREWKAEWVPREHNTVADAEASQCYPIGMKTLRERHLSNK
jgi:ribonuclease HI